MDEAPTPLQPQQFASAPRQLGNLFSSFPDHAHRNPAAYNSQLDPNLRTLDSADAFSAHHYPQLSEHGHGQQMHMGHPYAQGNSVRFQEVRSHLAVPPTQQQQQQGDGNVQIGHLGPLTPQAQIPQHAFLQHNALDRIQQESESSHVNEAPNGSGKKEAGHFANMKSIPNPPDLEAWRERLFHVDQTITLTEEEFQIYFPHVDNIYSHRSTQRYKRKPFVSHYWDCRLKGRPPGTPKSNDPNKRKRKRQARERDLCDVKIKITEYFPGAKKFFGEDFNSATDDPTAAYFAGEQFGGPIQNGPQSQSFGATASQSGGDVVGIHSAADGGRYYTIQRVNGNGGNGKGDGVPGPHKHTLEESDRVKKNSIQRICLKEEKEKKKIQKTYHKKATGLALTTAKRHSKDHDLKLFGSCFCPFVQRVWIALELKGMNYQYIEVDPYKKPESLLEVNPLGLVPAIRHGDWACHESTVLIEYLEDLNTQIPLLPANDPKARAHSRLWADHINRKLIPTFYAYLQAQDTASQLSHAQSLKTAISTLVSAANPSGPFFLGPKISFVDVQIAPWLLRLSRVLKPYRGWPDPEEGSRWKRWVDAVEANGEVRATTSGDELYLDSYERYAENRPDTSQVADAINAGRGLP